MATTSADTVHCGHAWPLSVDGVCGTLCDSYCTAAMTHCTAANALYADMATCLTECSAFPDDATWTPANSVVAEGDSVQCPVSYTHLTLPTIYSV